MTSANEEFTSKTHSFGLKVKRWIPLCVRNDFRLEFFGNEF
jgi:hypothetical protein